MIPIVIGFEHSQRDFVRDLSILGNRLQVHAHKQVSLIPGKGNHDGPSPLLILFDDYVNRDFRIGLELLANLKSHIFQRRLERCVIEHRSAVARTGNRDQRNDENEDRGLRR
jgi:hypothetical protein